MVSATSTVPLAGTAPVPDNTTGFAFAAFRQRCELQPEPWRAVSGPQPLGERKALQEDKEVAAAKRRPAGDRARHYARLTRDIEVKVARFKRAYTEYDSPYMLSIAMSLRQPVHQLRVLVRAGGDAQAGMPPRRSQMGDKRVNSTDLALAWIHQIDLFLVGNDKKPGIPLDVWRRSYQVEPLESFPRYAELSQISVAKREPHYKRLDRAESLVDSLRLDLDRHPDAYTYPRLDKTVRALRVTLGSLGHHELPPHWLQYRYAGGFPADNCRVWRNGITAWLDDYDCVPTYHALDSGAPPAYETTCPPAYGTKKKRVAQRWRRFLLIA